MGRSGGEVVNGGELAEYLFELSVVGVGLQDGFAGAESGEIDIKGVSAGALGCGEGAFGGGWARGAVDVGVSRLC